MIMFSCKDNAEAIRFVMLSFGVGGSIQALCLCFLVATLT